MQPSRTIVLISYAVILLVTVLLYLKAANFDFINLDDDVLLLDNPYVNSGVTIDNLIWAVTSTDKFQYVPVTWFSHMIDFDLYGMKAAGHHVTNIILHLLNTLLLSLFLYKATGKHWHSAGVALLFALHPLHVEPVAWIAARKDLLSTFFCFITFLLYLNYVKRPVLGRYLLVSGAYILSLAAKPMMMTLPLLLLALDYWPLQRLTDASGISRSLLAGNSQLRRLVYEKVPLLLITAIFARLAYIAQSKCGAVASISSVTLTSRVSNAIVNYGTTLFKTFWPEKLAILYPFRYSIPAWEILLSALLLVTITYFAVTKAKAHPYLLAGWFWYIVTFVPVIGLVQIGPSSTYDKCTYIPLIGFFIMLVWGMPNLLKNCMFRRQCSIVALTAAFVVMGMFARSWSYLACWKDSITLYHEAIRVTGGHYLVFNNLGAALFQKKNYGEALKAYQESMRAYPGDYVDAYANIGAVYFYTGDYSNALHYYSTALQLQPDFAAARIGVEASKKALGRAQRSNVKQTQTTFPSLDGHM